MKEFFGFFVLTLVAHFAVVGTVENFYVYGKPSPKLIDKIVYVVAGLTVALSTYIAFIVVSSDGGGNYFKLTENVQFIVNVEMIFGTLCANFLVIAFTRWSTKSDIKNEQVAQVQRQKVAEMSPAELKRHKTQLAAIEKQTQANDNERYYGRLNKQLVCPHCQTKGFVRKQSKTRVTKTRVNSVAARAVGLGTNTENKVTAMRCDNCETEWDVA